MTEKQWARVFKTIYWNKGYATDTSGGFLTPVIEPALVAQVKKTLNYPSGLHTKDRTTRIDIPGVPVSMMFKDGEDIINRCQKPPALSEFIIKHFGHNMTNPLSWVLSSFAGTGADLVACIRNGWNCIAYDATPQQFAFLVTRISTLLQSKHAAESANQPFDWDMYEFASSESKSESSSSPVPAADTSHVDVVPMEQVCVIDQ